MHEDDKKKIIERYTARAQEHGHGPIALGEPRYRQAFYYHFMTDADGFGKDDSILDVGCGYGDFHSYLLTEEWSGIYCGIDINASLVEEGQAKTPGIDLRVHDIQEEPLRETFDWAFACHVITSATEQIDYLEHLESMVESMWRHADKGILFNLLSPLADYKNEIHARPAFGDVLDIVSNFTNRFEVKHHYMPFEFSLYLYKENEIDRDKLIFSAFGDLFEDLKKRHKREV